MLGIIQRDNDIFVHPGPNRFCIVWKTLTSFSRSMVVGECYLHRLLIGFIACNIIATSNNAILYFGDDYIMFNIYILMRNIKK